MKQFFYKKFIFLYLTIFFAFIFESINAENGIFIDSIESKVDKKAVFKGKPNKIEKFIKLNTEYPFQAWLNCTEGVVNISFIVTKDGKIDLVKVEKGIDPLLDEEALRVVKMMNSWKPAIKNKEKVHSQVTIPVSFFMSEQEKQFSQTFKKYEFDENAPLYVIDNKIVETFIILPHYNLRSLKVLKGEKAISKYGMRAKNGVVEITTKRGTPH